MTKAGRARALRRFHGVATIVWAILIIPTVIWWRNSILWIGLMSAYTAAMGHFGAWQASRAETSP